MTRARAAFAWTPCVLALAVVLQNATMARAMRSALTERASGSGPRSPDDRNAVDGGDETRPLIAAANGIPGIIAGAVAGRLREEGIAGIRAAGQTATNVALKSIIVAARYVADDFPGKVLAVMPSKEETVLISGDAGVCYLLEVRAVPKIACDLSRPDAVSSNFTNAGKLAAFLSRRLRKQDTVTIGAIGAKAIYRVMKAAAYAQQSLAEQPDTGKSKIALVPSVQEVERKGTKLVRKMFVCIRMSV